jgi:hypothetical protein
MQGLVADVQKKLLLTVGSHRANRPLIALQVRHLNPRGQQAGADDLQTVVVYGNTDRTPRQRVVPVAQRVDQGFTQGQRRIERRILPLQLPRLNATGDRDISQDEMHGLIQNLKRMAVQLAVVEKLGFVRPFEAGQARGALRVVRHLFAAEQHNRRTQ